MAPVVTFVEIKPTISTTSPLAADPVPSRAKIVIVFKLYEA
jgi:hypothetical protein